MTTRGRGRPRREGTDEAILEAARALIRERGFRDFNVDEITSRTGVAKTTIYRRWPSKASLAAAAFEAAFKDSVAAIDGSDPASVVRSLEDLLSGEFGPIAAAVIAEAQSDPSLRETVRAFTEPHRELLARTMPAAEADEKIGAIWFRLLVPLSEAGG